MTDKLLGSIYKVVNSANVNFLIGAGLSHPYLDLLDKVEEFLNDKTKTKEQKLEKKKEFFNKVILGNLKLIDEEQDAGKEDVLNSYKTFFRIINNIILRRENSILTKQVNVFTTNIDIFTEKALEETGIEFNDGFNGRFNPLFDISNFKKSYFRKSLHYEKTSEIPVFNIIKLHGSLTWRTNDSEERIYLDSTLQAVRDTNHSLKSGTFEELYDKLTIINPDQSKYSKTLLIESYYDLLRIYSNELEKENSVLFVLGFSFKDSHIKKMTERVAASNPTLRIYIFAHSDTTTEYDELVNSAKNKNIEVLLPDEEKEYNLATLNSDVFGKIIEYESPTESSAQ